jgi:hypothetical protein
MLMVFLMLVMVFVPLVSEGAPSNRGNWNFKEFFKRPVLSVIEGNNSDTRNVSPGSKGNYMIVTFDASDSSEDIEVRGFNLVYEVSDPEAKYDLSNVKVYEDAITTIHPLSFDADPVFRFSDTIGRSKIQFEEPLVITKGTSRSVGIQANLSASAKMGAAHQFMIASPVNIKAYGSQSGSRVLMNGSFPIYGMQVTVRDNTKVYLNRTDNIEDTYVSSSTHGVNIGKFRIAATSNVLVENFYVDFMPVNGGGTDEITALYLYDGATQIAEAIVTSSNAQALQFNLEANPLLVGVGNSKELTMKIDSGLVDKSGVATNATPLEGFTPSINSSSMVARSASSGSVVAVQDANLAFADFVFVKSNPTVTVQSTGDSITSNGTYDLIDVIVAADSAGPVGLYKMSFIVSTTTVGARDFSLYQGSKYISGQYTSSTDGIVISPIDADHDLVEVYFYDIYDVSKNVEQVPAGTSKTYTLKANVFSYWASLPNGISTQLLGDADFAADTYSLNAEEVDATENDNFIWSDLSYGHTTTTSTTTKQWLSGYLVDGIPSVEKSI